MTSNSFPLPRERAERRVKSLERRIQSFEQLPEQEQRILIALAIFPTPTPRTPVVELCRAFDLRLDTKTIDATRLSLLVEGWQKLDLVAWDGSDLVCKADFDTYLIRLAAESPIWSCPNQAAVLRAQCSLQMRPTQYSSLCDARLLRLAGRDEGAGRRATEYLGLDGSARVETLFGPGDPWFLPLHVPLSDALLLSVLEERVCALQDHAWALELFDGLASPDQGMAVSLLLPRDARSLPKLRSLFHERGMLDGAHFRSLWYLWQILQGHEERVRHQAREDESDGNVSSLAYEAILDLAAGNLGKSIGLFERACDAKNNEGVAPIQCTWVGAMHVLALLVDGTPVHLQRAGDLIQRLIGKNSKKGVCEVPDAILGLATYRAHLTGSTLVNLRAAENQNDHPVSYLIKLLVLVWTTPVGTDTSNWTRTLDGRRQSVSRLTHRWLDRELEAAHDRLIALRTAAEPESGESRTLVNLVKPKSPWKLQLESLERLAAKADPVPKGSEPSVGASTRIVWMVRTWGDRLRAEPRLQSRKGASFTRGRPIALQRLLPPADPSLPVTKDDRSVCAHIHVRRMQYGHDEIYVDDDVCLGLVGHPYVFDQEDESLQHEVKRGRVMLRCEQADRGYSLRLEPSVASVFKVLGETAGSFVRCRGTEILVYQVTSGVREVAKIVGQEMKLPVDAEAQLKSLLPRMSSLVPTTASLAADDDSSAVPSDTIPVLRIRPKAEALRVQLLVTPFGPEGPASCPGEGPPQLSDFRDGQARHVRRDLESERSRAQALVDRLPSLGSLTEDCTWTTNDLVTCLGLISEMSQLNEFDARVEWPEGQPLRLKKVRAMHLTIAGGDAARWFEADGTLQFADGAELRIAEILAQMDRAKGRFVRLSTGDYAELSQSALERLELLRSFRRNSADSQEVRVAPWLALVMPKADSAGCIEDGNALWVEWRKRITSINKRQITPTKAFVGTLRDYQEAGFAWLCRMASLGTGVCLADDMGLGKTVQALAFLQYRASRKPATGEVTGPILIVAPASVCPGWLAEAARFTPNLEPRWLTGTARNLDLLTRRSVVICTYDILHRDAETLSKVLWDTVVLDEAHHIKNAHTRRARAAFSLQAGFRLATTGTPIENHLGELWSLFHFLMPGLLGDQHDFVERFRAPIENARDTVRLQQLQTLVRPFMLRRTKKQVLSELPPRTELVRQVQLSEAEIELYEAIRQRGLEALSVPAKDGNQLRIRVLAELMRLRRACCHPRLILEDSEVSSSKLGALLELVSELRDAGHRALVFSQFVDHLSLVREALDDLGVSYLYLDGSTPTTERARRVEAFQSGEGDLFLISLRAGGTGLNLTAADYVIHLDPWWNPAVEDQASDRAHRIGQQHPVTVYRLVTQGTIEERLVAMHVEKRSLVADILEGTEGTKRLDPDELMNLLRDAALGEKNASATSQWAVSADVGSSESRGRRPSSGCVPSIAANTDSLPASKS